MKIKGYIKTHKKLLTIIVMVSIPLIILAVNLAFIGTSLLKPESLDSLKNFFESLGYFGWFAMLFYQIARVILPILPAEPFELLAGAMYGTLFGTLTCMLGVFIGSVIVFGLTRKYGMKLLEKIFKPEKIEKYMYLRDWPSLDKITFLIYFLPGAPKDVFTYVIGLTNLSWGKFLFFSTVGRIPSIVTSTITADMVMQGRAMWGIIIYLIVAVISVGGMLFHNKVLEKKIK